MTSSSFNGLHAAASAAERPQPPQRLKIAVLSRNFSRTGGGAETYAIAVAEELAQRHEVHVFAQHIAHEHPAMHYHRISQPLARPRWINQLWFAYTTWRATRQGFDIVHSHENTWHGDIQTVHVLPVLHTLFAGLGVWHKAWRKFQVLTSWRLSAYCWLEKKRFAAQTGRTVVAASPLLLNTVRGCAQRVHRRLPNMTAIAPGVSGPLGLVTEAQRSSAREQLGLSLAPSTQLVLLVANDAVRKGMPQALRALAVGPAHIHLLAVGQGEHHASMRVLARQLGVAERVHFVGRQTNMPICYQAADALLHPTLEDSYGMVVLEAMAQGLPVVVSGAQHCGISHELQHGHTAWLVQDPMDVAAIAQGVAAVLYDAALRAQLQAQGVHFAQARTWQLAAQAYERLYAQAWQAKHPRERWLVLAHAFNMDGRAASQTVTDKLPHLEAAGIELVVLSGVSGRKDRHFEHYQVWPALAAGVRFELRHVLRRHIDSPVLYRLAMLLPSLILFPFLLAEKLLKPIESSWSWWISSYVVGRFLASRRRFDRIYSSGGAFAAHLAGRALQRSLGLPWLAEVHDPFIVPGHTPTTAQEKAQARVEQLICTHADAAVWFTQAALDSARRRHPQLGERGHMVLPGIDAPFEVMPPYVRGDRMVIGHFGSLSATRNLVPVIAALEILIQKHPELRQQLELQVTGGPLDAVSQACLEQSSVQDMVRHLGRIEKDPATGMSGREQILRRMRSADVLLLLHGIEPICAEYIPSKLYEYLWMQRPIVATVHQHPQMTQLLQEHGHCVVETGHAGMDSVAVQLASAVERCWEQWIGKGLSDNGIASPYTTEFTVQGMMGAVL
ncbi:glycosyltransferase [Curvibacter sp. CHRR-16]|uniref:glycosyltransferase family 4 protein n=1 Tax=Curvibacter sp. CHRR-16 TaxID=2835872 RepID=UPI001BDA8E82|nr:glycosyltransferase [Curvibacter sp. CHRR-16]MBT0569357.1 glycosyltransferase [Curvibacter sp. CHRR-16]